MWRARNESRAADFGDELRNVHGMQSVDILDRVYHSHNFIFIDVGWERELDKYAVDGRVFIEAVDVVFQLFLSDGGWEAFGDAVDSDGFACFAFKSKIDVGVGPFVS